MIVVANFLVTEGNRNTLAHREIRDTIRKEAQKGNESNLRVEIEPAIIGSDEQDKAEALGTLYNASIIIWGDDTGVRMTINFLNLREPDYIVSKVIINETERNQISNPTAFTQFIVDELPNQLTFLALFAIGRSYYKKEDFSRAKDIIELAATSVQQNANVKGLAEAYFHLGWLYQTPILENLDQSIKYYDRAIVLNPNYAQVYNNRATVYYHQKKFVKALADFDKAIALEPDKDIAYIGRALNYVRQEEFEKAISDFDKAIAMNSKEPSAYSGRGNIYLIDGDTEKALEYYNKAIALETDEPSTYCMRGQTLYKREKLEDALDDFRHCLELNPPVQIRPQIELIIFIIEARLATITLLEQPYSPLNIPLSPLIPEVTPVPSTENDSE